MLPLFLAPIPIENSIFRRSATSCNLIPMHTHISWSRWEYIREFWVKKNPIASTSCNKHIDCHYFECCSKKGSCLMHPCICFHIWKVFNRFLCQYCINNIDNEDNVTNIWCSAPLVWTLPFTMLWPTVIALWRLQLLVRQDLAPSW